MNPTWLSYLPRHVIENVLYHPDVNPVGQEIRFQAVALFADVSGFTAISEALGQAGRGGTEELTSILNGYFRPMIDLIESYGGIIGKFGGDAMTVLFPYTPETQMDTVRRSIQCAVEMQANMHHYEAIQTSAGVFGLTMKAGLAMGTTLATSIGDAGIRLEYIIAGRLLDLCADAEHYATKGEVVVHNALLACADEVEIVEARGDFTCIARLKKPAEKAPLGEFETIPERLHDRFSIFLHPIIYERMESGREQFINEHRKVTVLFVGFSGFDYEDDPNVVSKLQDYLVQVIRIVHRYDGYLNKVDMGDKGSKYIVLFGAPLAHENDEDRALLCALDLSRISGVQARIGINTGFVFSGQVGSPVRQEYTVMGDTVNLAARLMQAALPGQIMVSEMTRRVTKAQFFWDERAPIQVKGKSEPIAIALLRDVQKTSTVEIRAVNYQLPMIGRVKELELVQGKAELVLKKQGQMIGITAEAGMGKSRLIREITRQTEQRGFKSYVGECLSYGTKISYLVWQNIWRDLLYIDPVASLSTQIKQLEELLHSIDPSLVRRMSLLGVVLNLALPADPAMEALDGKIRQELLESLLLACLTWRSKQSPLLLVLEDTHWIDPLSRGLLEFLGRNIVDLPVFILQGYRPQMGRIDIHDPIRRFRHFTEIALTEFEEHEARELICLKLGLLFGESQKIPEELVERVIARAQGNPFYIEELINFIHDQKIALDDVASLQKLQLPDSLHSLIVSRVDRLHEQEKLTLKVASVLGRLFRASWLWGSYPEIGNPQAVKRQLRYLNEADLTLLEKPEPELEYLFKHVLTQEVTYESLAISTRETLHERIGLFIESTYSDNLDNFINVLAHHFGRSRNVEKQRIYFRRVGDYAKRAYANDAAIEYYRRLLPLLPESEQGDVLRHLGEVLQLTGQWDEAEAAYRQGLEKTPELTSAHAWCLTDMGHLMTSRESPASAVEWLKRAVAEFEAIDDQQGLARSLKYLGIAYMEQGKFGEALVYARRQLEIATQNQDRIGISEASMNIAWAYRDQGDLEQALDYLRESLAIAEDTHYQYGVVAANGDIAGLHYFQGQYAEAIASCLHALHAAHEIGFLQGNGLISSNMGEIYRKEGDHNRALACYTHSLHIAAQLGDWVQILFALGNIAIVFTEQKRLDEALRLYSPVIALARDLNIPYYLCELLYHAAVLYVERGQRHTAQMYNAEALEIASEVGQRDIVFQTTLLAIRLRILEGDISRDEAIRQLVELLKQWDDPGTRAAIHFEIWQLDHTQAESYQQARRLYRELYSAVPNLHNYQRLQELSSNGFPPPPTLPALPAIVQDETAGLHNLLERMIGQVQQRVG